MDTATARKRLEEIRSELDRSISVLKGEQPQDERILEYPQDTGEFVRHKTLDAVGDLALAGAPILGLYRAYRGSHRLNSAMLHALYGAKDAWTIVELAEKPAHRHVAPRADFGIAFAMPNYAPETA